MNQFFEYLQKVYERDGIVDYSEINSFRGDSYDSFTTWSANLTVYLDWHGPVSEKKVIDRQMPQVEESKIEQSA